MKTLSRAIIFLGVAGCWTATLSYGDGKPPTVQGIRQEVSTQGELNVVSYYRGDAKILQRSEYREKSGNTVFYIYLQGREIFTYKSGPMGTDFRANDYPRPITVPEYTIKMAGDKESRITRITIYSSDYRKTLDGFWLKNNELIPWSSDELENWRKMRDRSPKNKGF